MADPNEELGNRVIASLEAAQRVTARAAKGLTTLLKADRDAFAKVAGLDMKVIRGFFVQRATPAPPDTTPPTAPTGLSVTAASPPVSSWTASTDNLAVAGYEIWRRPTAGGPSIQLGTSVTINYTDMTAVQGTQYANKVRAYDAAGNLSSFTSEFTYTVPGALTADVTPPNTPSAPTLVSKTTTQIVIAMPTTTDPVVGGAITSGMKEYPVKVDGVVTGSPVPQPSGSLVFPGAGILVGSPALPGSDSNIAGVITVAEGGDEWSGTSDQLRTLPATVTGDFDISFRLFSLTSTAAYAKFGVAARSGSDAGAQYFAILGFTVASAIGMAVDYRQTVGGTAVNGYISAAQVIPKFGRITRVGNVFTAYIAATAGPWGTAVFSQSIGMPSSILLGPATASQDPTKLATGVVDNIVFTGSSSVTFTDTFAASATPVARLYSFAGRDNVGNTGAYSSTLSVTPTAAASGLKWGPGHYALSDVRPITPGTVDFVFSEFDEMVAVTDGSGNSLMNGFCINITWYYLEVSPGVYDTRLIDAAIQKMKDLSAAHGKTFRLIIQLNDASPGAVSTQNEFQQAPYSSPSQTYKGTLPSYIFAAGPLNGATGSGGLVFTDAYNVGSQTYYHPALWRSGVADPYIALITYLGNKYDSSPYVEAFIPIGETSWALAFPPSDLNDTNWKTQIKRIIDAKAAWPTTNYIVNSTWPPTNISNAALLEIFQYQFMRGCGEGGPDILYTAAVGYEVNGAQILRGAGGIFGSIDYRLRMASMWQEQADWSNWTAETAVAIEDYCYNVLFCTHIIWGNHHNYGGSGKNWTDVIAALRAVNFRIHAALPTG